MWNNLDNVWRPAVEILILAVLIYYAFRFVRGTRGWPVVIGFVVVLLALKAVTWFLDLKVLSWLLDSASVFIAVGGLVIFQPELRRMLAELGNMPLFASTSEQREAIEVIIQTAERLADLDELHPQHVAREVHRHLARDRQRLGAHLRAQAFG